MRTFLYFKKWSFLAFPSLKSKKNPLLKSFLYCEKLNKFLMFQEGTDKAPQNNKKSVLKKFLVSCKVFVIFTAAKHIEIPCDYLYSAVKHRKIPCDYFYSAVKHNEILCDYLYSVVKHREISCDYLHNAVKHKEIPLTIFTGQ